VLQRLRLLAILLAASMAVGLLSRALVQAADAERDVGASSAEFNFVRIRYHSLGGRDEAYYYYEGRVWERWETDFPQADENFVFRLDELTAVRPNRRAVVRRLTDDDLFSFPFIYMCDVGWMELSALEKARLREYLLKGGFLWVDDFWGLGEWLNFERIMSEVLEGRAWQPVPQDHPLHSTVFPLEGFPQVPARDFAVDGWLHDPPWYHRYPPLGIETVQLRGYFDDAGRLMVLASHNTDIGDGWEREGYGEWYFERYSAPAYAAGANVVVYALTH
jgi:hypothetical protein